LKDFEMLDAYLNMASLLVVACLFGGMFLFSASFAAFLFKYLPPEDARMLIRKAFPPFYLFVIVASGVAMLLSWRDDSYSAAWMAFVLLTTVGARQILMPAINRATDLGHKKRFLWLHGFSVLLTLGHIVLAGVVLVHMAH
jgi:UDP-N-acetylmuramyl pentapeptide phosphotransferase/UDP-N-acetylglucosamine-1-phosphate transferase